MNFMCTLQTLPILLINIMCTLQTLPTDLVNIVCTLQTLPILLIKIKCTLQTEVADLTELAKSVERANPLIYWGTK